jgi:hypothetical protein
VLPVSGIFDAQFDLVQVTDCLTKSFLISLRISSPFITYALITNFVIGLAGKLVPQIPLYFISNDRWRIIPILHDLHAIHANIQCGFLEVARGWMMLPGPRDCIALPRQSLDRDHAVRTVRHCFELRPRLIKQGDN